MKQLASCLAVAVLGALAACGGGSGSSSDPNPGALTIAVTDAASLELSMLRLEVTDIQLRKASGELVEALAGPVSVDFVSLEDLSRVLCLTTLPAGDYTHVRVTFGFSNALAHVLGSSTPATIWDWDGTALPPVLQLQVAFSGGFKVIGGRNRLLELDLDLDQSARVDSASNTVFLEPVFVFRLDPADPKELLVMGRLEKVKGNAIELGLEDQAGMPLQTIKVVVDQDSVYEIDGVPMNGAPGLAALAALPAGTSFEVLGALDPTGPSIASSHVAAGTGTNNGGLDIVEGHVIGRVGSASPQLTLYGRTENASHTIIESDVIVTVHTNGNETGVVLLGSAEPFTLDDLNVGQRVRAFGSLGGSVLYAGQPDSVVRLLPARTFGLALGPPSGGTLTLDLERVGILFETSFQWGEGGNTPLSPLAMIASVGSLADNLGIGAGTPVDLRGRFSPTSESLFDFTATAAANLDTAPALFLLQNRAQGVTVLPAFAAGEIQLALSGTFGPFEFARIDRGYLGSTPLSMALPFTANGGPGYYLIQDRTTAKNIALADFTDFAGALYAKVVLGAEIDFFGARGVYDETTNTMQVALATAVVD